MNNSHIATLRMLRECQSRSAREQQILSGRDWLFVTALVQFLTALYPLYRWLSDKFLMSHDPAVYQKYMNMSVCMLGVCAILMALWWWAKFAPFRAACVALGFYVVLQIYVAFCVPIFLVDRVASTLLILAGLVIAVRTGYRRRHSS